MPYTNDFMRIRKHFQNLYSDKARADTFAFKQAFNENIQTFEKTRRKWKLQKII